MGHSATLLKHDGTFWDIIGTLLGRYGTLLAHDWDMGHDRNIIGTLF